MNEEEFLIEIKELGITLDKEQLNKLNLFYELMIEWNQKINLTSIVEKEDVLLKHFFDSLTLYKSFDLKKDLNLCDVGSGAGFPGIVLKICFPNLKIILIDSLNKRVTYLNEVIKQLELTNISAVHTRMEDFSRINEEKYDIITARAVANTRVLAEISVRALKINGKLLLMKANVEEEIEESLDVFKKLNLKLEEVIKFTLPKDKGNRSIIKIVKTNKTPKQYPRTIDKIKKSIVK